MLSDSSMNNALPILYSFRRCPYAMRARLGIASSGVPVELREVLLRDKPGHMLTISPKGTVPVLLLPDGTVIDESREIMDWALAQSDPHHWRVLDSRLAELDSWLQENDGPFKADLDHYKYSVRFPEQPMEDYRAQGERFLHRLEARLSDQPYLMGKRPGMADMAVFPFIRQFAFVDKDWFDQTPYPHLQGWLQGFLDSELFARVMQKTPQWQVGNPIVEFPGSQSHR